MYFMGKLSTNKDLKGSPSVIWVTLQEDVGFVLYTCILIPSSHKEVNRYYLKVWVCFIVSS